MYIRRCSSVTYVSGEVVCSRDKRKTRRGKRREKRKREIDDKATRALYSWPKPTVSSTAHVSFCSSVS